MHQLKIEKLNKKYDFYVLKDITFSIRKGEFISILGPSGCGKSTLLKLIAGLEKETSGDIYIEGKKVNHLHPKDRNISMVFQNYALYPHMKVFDNIAVGLKLKKFPKKLIKEKVFKVSKLLRIDNLLDRYPSQLSGGQMQRVAVARAIVKNPSLFLLDEPLSNLDAQIREQTRIELKKLFKSLNATVLYVTHDQIEAMSMSDRIIVLNNGQIQQIGTPEQIYHQPENLFVATFVGNFRINILEGIVKDSIFQKGKFYFPVDTDYTGKAYLCIRPEHIKDTKTGKYSGNISLVENIGSGYIYTINMQDNIELRFLSTNRYSLGEIVSFTIKDNKYFLFDSRGRRI